MAEQDHKRNAKETNEEKDEQKGGLLWPTPRKEVLFLVTFSQTASIFVLDFWKIIYCLKYLLQCEAFESVGIEDYSTYEEQIVAELKYTVYCAVFWAVFCYGAVFSVHLQNALVGICNKNNANILRKQHISAFAQVKLSSYLSASLQWIIV